MVRSLVRSYDASPASQDLRPPGPVPPDVAPFRHAGSAREKPSLCAFSMAEGAGLAAQKGRAFRHHPEADSSPCATLVTNWIEDNYDLVWSHFASSQYCRQQRDGNRQCGEGSTTTIHQAGGQDGNGKRRRSRATEGTHSINSSNTGEPVGKQEGADASAASQAVAVLPNVVGAGGMAHFLPLLDATIGRCES